MPGDIAACIFCGALKTEGDEPPDDGGVRRAVAAAICKSCGRNPQREGDLFASSVLTNEFMDVEKLTAIGLRIQAVHGILFDDVDAKAMLAFKLKQDRLGNPQYTKLMLAIVHGALLRREMGVGGNAPSLLSAVCWNCGGSKAEPEDQCGKCGLVPSLHDDAVVSAALSRSFMATEALLIFQHEIRRSGRLPVDRHALAKVSRIIEDNDGRDTSGRIFDAIVECFTVDRLRGMSENEKLFRAGASPSPGRVAPNPNPSQQTPHQDGGVGCYSMLGITSIFCVIAAFSINYAPSRWIMGLLALAFFLAGFAVFRATDGKK